MTSLRQAFKNFVAPAQGISLSRVLSAFPISRPVSVSQLLHLLDRGGVLARLGGEYAKLVNQLDLDSQTLVGLVDLHTHPAAHLGFGTELFYGPPDGDPSQDFNNCNGFHGGWGIDNTEGNFIRQQAVNNIASQDYSPSWDHEHSGWPDFPAWPTWHDRLHQQVRVEMLERAWQGGLRLIVALPVHNHTLAVACQTRGPYDYKSATDAQIAAIKEMIAGQSFMELALSPSDVRQIIGNGKLAVVIGVEVDYIGNFYGGFQPDPADSDIRAEINRLFASGVRYFFPVHVLDNVFGGAALYEMAFNTANRFEFGAFYAPEAAPASSQITWTFDPAETFWGKSLDIANFWESIDLGFDPQSYPAPPPTTTGHRNSRGLQDRGQVALDALMRQGAMIDIDHMSEQTVQGTLDYTKPVNYPLFAGHGVIRSGGGSERAHLINVVLEILNRGGVFGVGIKAGLSSLQQTMELIRFKQLTMFKTQPGGIALGSDCSGMEQLPSERPGSVDAPSIVYRDAPGAPVDALERCQFGTRKEDINTFGFSHIGMYPDFIEDGISSGFLTKLDTQTLVGLQKSQIKELFNAPEAVASAWESCLNIASRMP